MNLLHEYKQIQEQANAVDSFEEHKEENVCKNLENDFFQAMQQSSDVPLNMT